MAGESTSEAASSATGRAAISASLSVGHRPYFSTHLLAGAQDAARGASELEGRLVAEGVRRFSLEHRGYVLSAIVLSTAFAEAALNEVLQDAADDHVTEKIIGVSADVRRSWSGLWVGLDSGGVGRTLDRYQAALVLADAERFDLGSEPWQSMRLVIDLRNHLVHYKPQTVFSDTPSRLAAGLRGHVAPNPLSTNRADVDGWLSGACAGWAVDSALAFVGDFAARTAARPNYLVVLDDLRESNP